MLVRAWAPEWAVQELGVAMAMVWAWLSATLLGGWELVSVSVSVMAWVLPLDAVFEMMSVGL